MPTVRKSVIVPHAVETMFALVDACERFEALAGHWRFAALGDARCRVELALDYAFANAALDTLLGPVVGHVMETLVARAAAQARVAP